MKTNSWLLLLGFALSCSKSADITDLGKSELFLYYNQSKTSTETIEIQVIVGEGDNIRCRILQPSVRAEINGIAFSFTSRGELISGNRGPICSSPELIATIPAPKDNLVSIKILDDKDTIEAQFELSPTAPKPKVISPIKRDELKGGDEIVAEWPMPAASSSEYAVYFTPSVISAQPEIKVDGKKVSVVLPEKPQDYKGTDGPIQIELDRRFDDPDFSFKDHSAEAKSCKGVSKCTLFYGIDKLPLGTYGK